MCVRIRYCTHARVRKSVRMRKRAFLLIRKLLEFSRVITRSFAIRLDHWFWFDGRQQTKKKVVSPQKKKLAQRYSNFIR